MGRISTVFISILFVFLAVSQAQAGSAGAGMSIGLTVFSQVSFEIRENSLGIMSNSSDQTLVFWNNKKIYEGCPERNGASVKLPKNESGQITILSGI